MSICCQFVTLLPGCGLILSVCYPFNRVWSCTVSTLYFYQEVILVTRRTFNIWSLVTPHFDCNFCTFYFCCCFFFLNLRTLIINQFYTHQLPKIKLNIYVMTKFKPAKCPGKTKFGTIFVLAHNIL